VSNDIPRMRSRITQSSPTSITLSKHYLPTSIEMITILVGGLPMNFYTISSFGFSRGPRSDSVTSSGLKAEPF
jgi:hypothetical protein